MKNGVNRVIVEKKSKGTIYLPAVKEELLPYSTSCSNISLLLYRSKARKPSDKNGRKWLYQQGKPTSITFDRLNSVLLFVCKANDVHNIELTRKMINFPFLINYEPKAWWAVCVCLYSISGVGGLGLLRLLRSWCWQMPSSMIFCPKIQWKQLHWSPMLTRLNSS